MNVEVCVEIVLVDILRLEVRGIYCIEMDNVRGV